MEFVLNKYNIINNYNKSKYKVLCSIENLKKNNVN